MKSLQDFDGNEVAYRQYLESYYAIQIFCKIMDSHDRWQHDGHTPESAASIAKQYARTLIQSQ